MDRSDDFERSETFSLNSVPRYLAESSYYLACLENVDQSESDDTICDVPLHCRKCDTSVQNCEDLTRLLNTIRFWCLGEVPAEVISFCLTTKFEPRDVQLVQEILTEFEENFAEVKQLRQILTHKGGSWADNISRCENSIELNSLSMLKIIVADSGDALNDHWSRMVSTAARYDRLDCLIYLHSISGSYMFSVQDACTAAECGSLSCLRFILDHFSENKPSHGMVPMTAARAGQLECLQCAHQHGCLMSAFVVHCAVQNNQIDCLRFVLSVNCPYSSEITATAANLGHLECLQILHAHGCGFDSLTCENAAANNHLACLTFAHTHGAVLNEESYFRALKHGYLDILKYVCEAGVPFSRRLCHTAIYHGQLECLKYMIENGCPWVDNPTKLALQFKHQHIHEYILSCGFT